MPLYEYRCPAGHVLEKRASYSEDVTACACGEPASRVAVYRVNFGGFASTAVGQQDFREDFRRYNEAIGEVTYSKARYEDAAQVKTPEPQLFKAAKVKAEKLERAGVTADSIKT